MQSKKVNSRNLIRPWLNPDGSTKADVKLKEISKNWAPDIWEQYLSEFEANQSKNEISFGPMLDLLNSNVGLSDLLPITHSEQLQEFKKILKQSLSKRELDVIKYLYVEEFSERGLAEKLSVSRRTIRTLKTRGLKKIEQALLNKIEFIKLMTS